MYSLVLKNFEGYRFFLHENGEPCECLCDERFWSKKPSLEDVKKIYDENMFELIHEVVLLKSGDDYTEEILYQLEKE